MSESVSRPPAPGYIDVMAEPVIEGLLAFRPTPADELAMQKLQPWTRPYTSQSEILKRLKEINWTQWNLPEKEAEERTLSPHEYSCRLLAFAYDDGLTQLKIGATTTYQAGITDPAEQRRILHASAGALLLPAGIKDRSKGDFTAYLKNTVLGLSGYRPSMLSIALIADIEQPLVYNTNTRRLEWDELVRRWLALKADEGGGCPAHEMIIEVGGKKQVLTHFFWHKLVDIAYAVEPNSDPDLQE